MIQANELRIGNYVYMIGDTAEELEYLETTCQFDRVAQVTSFSEHDTGVVSHWKAKSSIGGTIHSGGYSEHLHPIPLTEEILLKCGFKIYKDSMYCGGIGPLGLVKDDGKYFLCAQDDTGYILDGAVQIESLHHLQNVYSDLEREELNVQL